MKKVIFALLILGTIWMGTTTAEAGTAGYWDMPLGRRGVLNTGGESLVQNDCAAGQEEAPCFVVLENVEADQAFETVNSLQEREAS